MSPFVRSTTTRRENIFGSQHDQGFGDFDRQTPLELSWKGLDRQYGAQTVQS
jgi:hypothetical protein